MIHIVFQYGPFIWLILFCSVVALSIIIERAIFIAVSFSGTGLFVADILQKVKQNRIKEALESCEKPFLPANALLRFMFRRGLLRLSCTPVASIFQAAILRYDQSRERIKEALQDAWLYEVPKFEHNLQLLIVLAHVSLLLGFLGTAAGLAKCFISLQRQSVSMANLSVQMISQGIWEAIICTIAGLIVAIPVYVGYSYLTSRINLLVIRIETAATELVNTLND